MSSILPARQQPAAPILAIDLGKFRSVACIYFSAAEHTFNTIDTTPTAVHDLIVTVEPQRVVIEVGNAAGWIKDLCDALQLPIQIANPNHEAWRWKSIKCKTDRQDALKLARLSASDQLPTLWLPGSHVRQWRSLIQCRASFVAQRTRHKNAIRAVLDRQGLSLPKGKNAWTDKSLRALGEQATPLNSPEDAPEVAMDSLWRCELWVHLQALEHVSRLIEQLETKLDALGQSDAGVMRLQTIPGVGPRLSELLVAVIGDPHRFKNRRQVGAYVGLVPRLYESGTMSRSGRITGSGHRLLRALLVEVAWMMRQYNAYLRGVFDQVCRGVRGRRKIAVVATARRLLITCWAMLRNGTDWRTPAAGSAASL